MKNFSVFSFNFPWKIQRRQSVPVWLNVLVRLLAVLLAFLVVGFFLKLGGINLFSLLQKAFKQILGNFYGVQQAIILATPLLMTGLSVALCMRMSLWNIGAEGQFLIGAFMATGVALNFNGPLPVMLVIIFLAGALGGLLWTLVPALVRTFWNVNEIITTLLLNFVAVFLVNYFAIGPWRDKTAPTLSATPRLPYELPTFGDTYLHIGIIIPIIAAILLALAFKSTKLGYEIRIIGTNRRVAEFAGMPVRERMLLVMLLSGAIAGIGGMIEVTGTVHRLSGLLSNNYGFLGIIVAALANGSPIAVIFTSILLALLLNAGIVLQAQGLSVNTVIAINGVILIFAAIGESITHYHLVRIEVPQKSVEANAQVLESECPGLPEKQVQYIKTESGK
ncbi:MAG: ABC transporter permease [Anaerolineaceae bacterium]|nr:ABC transporter permease [Anaerolineaceae bacterium]